VFYITNWPVDFALPPFPPPCGSVEELEAYFVVRDRDGQEASRVE
jgi:hypothetical protein